MSIARTIVVQSDFTRPQNTGGSSPVNSVTPPLRYSSGALSIDRANADQIGYIDNYAQQLGETKSVAGVIIEPQGTVVPFSNQGLSVYGEGSGSSASNSYATLRWDAGNTRFLLTTSSNLLPTRAISIGDKIIVSPSLGISISGSPFFSSVLPLTGVSGSLSYDAPSGVLTGSAGTALTAIQPLSIVNNEISIRAADGVNGLTGYLSVLEQYMGAVKSAESFIAERQLQSDTSTQPHLMAYLAGTDRLSAAANWIDIYMSSSYANFMSSATGGPQKAIRLGTRAFFYQTGGGASAFAVTADGSTTPRLTTAVSATGAVTFTAAGASPSITTPNVISVTNATAASQSAAALLVTGGVTASSLCLSATTPSITSISTDSTFGAPSDSALPTTLAISNMLATKFYNGWPVWGNSWLSGLQVTQLSASQFSIAAGTWVYYNTSGATPTFSTISYAGSGVVVDLGLSVPSSQTHVYINAAGSVIQSFDSFLNTAFMTTDCLYIATILHALSGGSFVILAIADYTLLAGKQQNLSWTYIPLLEEVMPMLHEFPRIADAGNNDLSINVTSFSAYRPGWAVKAGNMSPIKTQGALTRPPLLCVYRATQNGPLVQVEPVLQTMYKLVVPAIGYGTPTALGVARWAAYAVLYEILTGFTFVVLPSQDHSTADAAAANRTSNVNHSELRPMLVIGYIIISGAMSNFTTATILRGAKFNYGCT